MIPLASISLTGDRVQTRLGYASLLPQRPFGGTLAALLAHRPIARIGWRVEPALPANCDQAAQPRRWARSIQANLSWASMRAVAMSLVA